MNKKDIQAARARCEAMKFHKGWAWRPRANGSKFADGTPVCEVVAADRTIVAYDVGEPEARFIAAAYSYLPAALEALEEARRKLKRIGSVHMHYEPDSDGCTVCTTLEESG